MAKKGCSQVQKGCRSRQKSGPRPGQGRPPPRLAMYGPGLTASLRSGAGAGNPNDAGPTAVLLHHPTAPYPDDPLIITGTIANAETGHPETRVGLPSSSEGPHTVRLSTPPSGRMARPTGSGAGARSYVHLAAYSLAFRRHELRRPVRVIPRCPRPRQQSGRRGRDPFGLGVAPAQCVEQNRISRIRVRAADRHRYPFGLPPAGSASCASSA